ncbi:rRNA-processing protein FCF1-like [Gracilariopsis chorda]|uniref:rRNA-processing protein FCF1-like n=1 Tax=Gracilariopsis chorda TaxID=448386 RepID=A0A2V3J5W2_9FLOR|nr:rRNA-processing protein FCF1-like [Gracilariopsis chorda]|eukprot:PXF49811.1 rRNA-processing protein FCF1-like [Gracilariopsis chorda]
MRHSKGGGGQNRKVLAFYRVNFNFIPPFQVLCDADIIHEAMKKDLYLKQTLPNMLSASAQPVVTSCVISDLRGRGNEYSSAAVFAKRATRLPCNHEGTLPAVDCLLRRLESHADPKVFVAAANRAILKQIASIPGIPLISIMNQTKLALRPPNKATLDHILLAEKSKTMAISDADKALLARVTEAEKASKPIRTIARRHRKAKGPNPLSVKKSRKPLETNKNQKIDNCVLPREVSDQNEHSTKSQLDNSKLNSKTAGECAVSEERNQPSSNGKRNRRRRRQSSNTAAVDNAKLLESKDLRDKGTLSPPRKVRRKDTDISSSGPVAVDKMTDPATIREDVHLKQSRSQGSENGVNGKHVGFMSVNSLKTADRYDEEERHVALQNAPGATCVSDRPIRKSDTKEQTTSPKRDTVETCVATVNTETSERKYGLRATTDSGEQTPRLEQDVAKRKKQRKNRRRRPQKTGR